MFYCNLCAIRRAWPETMFKSEGTCELCGATAICNDRSSQDLPIRDQAVEPYRDERLHVLSRKCDTCVLHPGNLMHLNPGALKVLIQQNLEAQSALVCHNTLPYGRYPKFGAAICAGFWERYRNDVPVLRLAQTLEVVTEVDPPGESHGR